MPPIMFKRPLSRAETEDARHGIGSGDGRRAKVALIIGLAVLLHRIWLWKVYGRAVRETVRANPDWLAWQFLPVDAYVGHFGAALYYLQQTPPLPHLVLGILIKALGWPAGVADALIVLQVCISAGTAAMLFLLLMRIRCPLPIAAGTALWFGLSTDLYLLELNSMGQRRQRAGLHVRGRCG